MPSSRYSRPGTYPMSERFSACHERRSEADAAPLSTDGFFQTTRCAGHEPEPRRRIAGYDLTRMDAGADHEAHAPRGFEFLVQRCEPRAHRGGREGRPQGVILMGAGETEHGHDRVPDVLLDESSVPLDAFAHGIEVTVQHGAPPGRATRRGPSIRLGPRR
jgi:hypothetical protein